MGRMVSIDIGEIFARARDSIVPGFTPKLADGESKSNRLPPPIPNEVLFISCLNDNLRRIRSLSNAEDKASKYRLRSHLDWILQSQVRENLEGITERRYQRAVDKLTKCLQELRIVYADLLSTPLDPLPISPSIPPVIGIASSEPMHQSPAYIQREKDRLRIESIEHVTEKAIERLHVVLIFAEAEASKCAAGNESSISQSLISRITYLLRGIAILHELEDKTISKIYKEMLSSIDQRLRILTKRFSHQLN